MAFPITSDGIATLAAYLAIACYSAWPLFRTRRAMLLMQLFSLASVALHYALVDAATASVMNLLGAVQIVASLLFGTRPKLSWIGYAFAACMIAASFYTWNGMPSLLATAGMVLVAIGRAQANAQTMRLLVLASAPLWLAHDLLISSPMAIADAISLVIGLWTTGQRPDSNAERLSAAPPTVAGSARQRGPA